MPSRVPSRASLLAARAITGPVAFFVAGVMDWARLLATLARQRVRRG